MDDYLMQKSEKFRNKNNVIARNQYVGRKDKKGDFRRLWSIKLNAALREINEKYSYSKFIGSLKKNNIEIDRKVLADLAENNKKVLAKIVAEVKK